MKTVTATRASRGFSEMLDQVEQGKIIRIVRDGRAVAEIRPATLPSGRALREALAAQPALDDEFAADIATERGTTSRAFDRDVNRHGARLHQPNSQ